MTDTTTSAYRFTRHADEYAVTRPMEYLTAHLGTVRRTGKTWTARPASVEQGAHLYVTEHWTRANAAAALDAAHLAALAEEHGDHDAADTAPAAPVETASASMARQSLAAKERELRATIANLDGGYLARIGLDTPEAIERHIAAEVREESAALGLARWAVDPITGAALAPEGRPVRVTRPAHTIEQGERIILDGDTVTVLDVRRDDTARTVTLTTSYGAPRTVTRGAAVPVVVDDAAAPVDVTLTWPATDAERDELRAEYLAATTDEQRRTAAMTLGGDVPLGCSGCDARRFVDSSAEEEAWWAVHGGADEPCTVAATRGEDAPDSTPAADTRDCAKTRTRKTPMPFHCRRFRGHDGKCSPYTLAPLTREQWEALTPAGHCDCGACTCACPACKTAPLVAAPIGDTLALF